MPQAVEAQVSQHRLPVEGLPAKGLVWRRVAAEPQHAAPVFQRASRVAVAVAVVRGPVVPSRVPPEQAAESQPSARASSREQMEAAAVSYTHLRAHETPEH